ncbi:MAG: FG-GAP repeat domain-containing protein [Planctomycetota bacterium]
MPRIRTFLGKRVLLAVILLPGIGCLPVITGDEPTDREISEVEPNDDLTTAQSTSLDDIESFRLSGSIANQDDIDIYELGHLDPGDRITVNVNIPETEIITSVAIFQTDPEKTVGILFATDEEVYDEADSGHPLINETVRHASDHYFLAITRAFGFVPESGNYNITVRVERGNPAPQPQAQTVLLDFNGWTGTTPAGQTVTVEPFDVESIDSIYAGQNQTVKDLLIATVKENFAGFNVHFLSSDGNTPDPNTSFSTVFIGQNNVDDNGIAGSEGLGFALEGTDPYNNNPADTAAVFTNKFGPSGLEVREPFTPQELGTVIGNVVTHEVGHLLGLFHVIDPTSSMNTFDTVPTLLVDQRFKMAPLHFAIFDSEGVSLIQDSRLILAETVGRTDNVPHATITVGHAPRAITSADMDNDTDIDLVTANSLSNDIWVIWNNGNGTFERALGVDFGSSPRSLAPADMNSDGHIDLVTANADTPGLALLLNDGQGRFADARGLTTDDSFTAVITADFNGDGNNDLAAANSDSGNVSVLTNDGTGSFTLQATIPVDDTLLSLVADDLDADGDPDLATCLALSTPGSRNVSVLLNNGDATFAEQTRVIAGLTPNTLNAADLDGDGDLDLAVANSLPSLYVARYIGNVSILTNDGSGTFSPAGEFFTGSDARSIATGDFDSDGDVDLAVACYGYLLIPQDTGQVSVLLNKGDGTFAQDFILKTGQGPKAITAADFDHDSDLDLAVANEDDSTVSIFLNDGQANFGISVPANTSDQ